MVSVDLSKDSEKECLTNLLDISLSTVLLVKVYSFIRRQKKGDKSIFSLGKQQLMCPIVSLQQALALNNIITAVESPFLP